MAIGTLLRPAPAVLALGLALAAALPGTARGQACLGVPFPGVSPAAVPGTGLAALGGVGFASHRFEEAVNGVEYGIEARAGIPLGFAASAGAWRRSMGEGPDPTVLRAEASWTIPRLPLVPQLGLEICPVAGVSGSLVTDDRTGDDFTSVTFPVGVAAGLPLTAGRELAIVPYGALRWLFSRVDGTVLGVEVDETDDSPSLELGVGARLGRLLGVASYTFAGLDALDVGPGAYPDRLFTLRVGFLLF